MEGVRDNGVYRIGLVGVMLVSLLAAGAGQAAGQEVLGVLTASQGEVSISRPSPPPGRVLAVRAGVREQLFAGDVVKTGADALAKLLLRDDSLITLGEDSELEVTEALFEPAASKRSTTVKLLHGVARAVIPPVDSPNPDSRFTIETRTAVVGVRGSEGGCQIAERVVEKGDKKEKRWATKCCSRLDKWRMFHKDKTVAKREEFFPAGYCTEAVMGESVKTPWPMGPDEARLLFPDLREVAIIRPSLDVPQPPPPPTGQVRPPGVLPTDPKEFTGLQPPFGQTPGEIPSRVPLPPPPKPLSQGTNGYGYEYSPGK